jgi:NADPH2:quinone reductase
MKIVEFDHFGPPDVLKVVDVPTPEPRPGAVLVRVKAAGVNFFEVLMRADLYAMTPILPMAPGVEVAGVVEKVGENVDVSLRGKRVAIPLFATGGAGGYAEFVQIDADAVVQLPDQIGFDEAVALMVQGLTALHLVRQSPPRGKTVLVHAAAGGVGSLLLQLARREGAKAALATASSDEKRALAISLGADRTFDYTRAGWSEQITADGGVDIVYDTVGGDLTKPSMEALAPCGELVFAALGRFTLDPADINRMFEMNQSLKGFALLPLISREGLRRDLSQLFSLASSTSLRIPPITHFALHDAAAAHAALEARRILGKVVLVP